MKNDYDEQATSLQYQYECARNAGQNLSEPLALLLLEARTRWLKCAEVGDLLLNYRSYGFQLSKTPPHQPPGALLGLVVDDMTG